MPGFPGVVLIPLGRLQTSPILLLARGALLFHDQHPAAETGTGTGSDLSRDWLGLVGFLGSSFGTTMVVSGSRIRVLKQQGARAKRGIGDV